MEADGVQVQLQAPLQPCNCCCCLLTARVLLMQFDAMQAQLQAPLHTLHEVFVASCCHRMSCRPEGESTDGKRLLRDAGGCDAGAAAGAIAAARRLRAGAAAAAGVVGAAAAAAAAAGGSAATTGAAGARAAGAAAAGAAAGEPSTSMHDEQRIGNLSVNTM